MEFKRNNKSMDRVNRILQHPLFIQYMKANAVCETERIFCRHDMAHVTDVARIAYILFLEQRQVLEGEKAPVKAEGILSENILNGKSTAYCKELIYAAALLHDIGRHVQYETGEKHAISGAGLAPEILRDCGFDAQETGQICSAIASHSDKKMTEEASLKGLLAKADRLSRACYRCEASAQCNWSAERKNTTFEI